MPPEPSKHHFTVWYVFAAVLGILAAQWLWQTSSQVETLSYSQFSTLVAEHKVKQASVGQDTITGTLKAPLPGGSTRFVTARVDPQIAESLAVNGVEVTGVPPGGAFVTILSWIVPAFVFYLVWYFLIRRMIGGQVLAA